MTVAHKHTWTGDDATLSVWDHEDGERLVLMAIAEGQGCAVVDLDPRDALELADALRDFAARCAQ